MDAGAGADNPLLSPKINNNIESDYFNNINDSNSKNHIKQIANNRND